MGHLTRLMPKDFGIRDYFGNGCQLHYIKLETIAKLRLIVLKIMFFAGSNRYCGEPKISLLFLVAQIGRNHPGVLLDFLRRALGDFLAEVQHYDSIGHVHNHSHIVLDEDN